MKKWFFILMTVSIAVPSSAQENSFRKAINQKKWIPFQWVGDTMGGRRFDKLAIFIAAQLNHTAYPFTLQFDTGSNISGLYGNVLESLQEQSPSLKKSLPDLKRKIQGGYEVVNLKMLPVGPELNNVWVAAKYGKAIVLDKATKNDPIQIGTWGADVCVNRYLIMDFPNQRIALLDTLLANNLNQVDFVDIDIRNNRARVPVYINDQKYYFSYDSGGSLFPLLMTKKNWDIINPVATTDTIKRVSTAGTYSDVYGARIDRPVRLGNVVLPTQVIYYHPDPHNKQQPVFDSDEVIGTIGNAYFFNQMIVVDYKHKRFGIVKK